MTNHPPIGTLVADFPFKITYPAKSKLNFGIVIDRGKDAFGIYSGVYYSGGQYVPRYTFFPSEILFNPKINEKIK